ncbi:MAG: Type 1 glutamine amidotransferase-like domain-containing protein [Planctomycetes bacterium]|nr:Type 1 glutamine amidotransferase-like domain-containing protein [Planctomycetota bacterium]
MTASFFLAADHRALDLLAVRALLPAGIGDGARICYVGAAHEDDRRWARDTIRRLETEIGLPCDAPRLSDPSLDVDAARHAIETAALIFLDGGDTVGLVAHAHARGLAEAFTRCARRDVVVAGVSAGSCAAAPFTIGWDEAERPLVAPCFSMGVPAPIDVHSEDDDWAEMRILLELVRGRPEFAQDGIVIPTRSALVFDAKGKMSSRGKRPCERRRLDPDGSWRIEVIP